MRIDGFQVFCGSYESCPSIMSLFIIHFGNGSGTLQALMLHEQKATRGDTQVLLMT